MVSLLLHGTWVHVMVEPWFNHMLFVSQGQARLKLVHYGGVQCLKESGTATRLELEEQLLL